MKKIIFALVLCLSLMNISNASYAVQDPIKAHKEAKKAELQAQKAEAKAAAKAKKAEIKALKKTYKKVTRNIGLMRSLELMKNSPASGAYEKIMGNNPTLNPMKVKYKNLGAIKPEYRNFHAMSKVKRKKITINVNSKYKTSPFAAQSAAIAGMTAHVDKKESVNELVYSKTLEAFLWNYYLKKNPDLKADKSPLTISENRLLRLYKQYPRTSREIEKAVRKQRSDIKYTWESTGYTHKEYTDKMKKVYEAYEAVEGLYGKSNKVMPVSNYKENTVIEDIQIELDPEEQYIKDHIRSDIKANPNLENHYIHQVSSKNTTRCEICGCLIQTQETTDYNSYEEDED